MLGLFKKKDPVEKLQKQYNRLLQEAHQLSTTDRKASDEKMAEAELIVQKITELKNNK